MTFICCKKEVKRIEIVNEEVPVTIIGSDSEEKGVVGVYKGIKFYGIGEKTILIGDIIERKIDVYDMLGNYLHSIGRAGQGPGEFEAIAPFAINKNEVLYALTAKKKIMIFEPNGKLRKEVQFPAHFKNTFAENIKIDRSNNVYILFSSSEYGLELAKFNEELDKYSVVHSDRKRDPLDFNRATRVPILPVDFAIDAKGNVYITDSIYYRIFCYDNEGTNIRVFEANKKRNRIKRRDLIINLDGNIMDLLKLDGNIWQNLKGNNRYLPMVFGIEIDGSFIYLWTSEQDKESRYIIDIYDMNFRKVGYSSFYDYLPLNCATIQYGKLFIPNVFSDDPSLRQKVGRLSALNMPYKLYVYDILLNKNVN
ncbi:MAG: 6-bladed beta-propeller [Nitrososphaeraceae archaeon]